MISSKGLKMKITQQVRCPNCGSEAERHHLLSSQLTRTQCPACDYLMVMCSRSGRVVEAYAPGINPNTMISLPEVAHKQHPLPSHENSGRSQQSVAASKC